MKIWTDDPITKAPSPALTMFIIACILMIAGIIIEAFTNMRSTHLLDEFFGACLTLYGGHMVTFRNSINTATTNVTQTVDNPDGQVK